MSNKEYDGMRYPSIDELLEKIDSKYKLAYAAARRAKIIEEEDGYTPLGESDNLPDPLCYKPIGIALEEILQDLTKITFKKN
jgi:DNA-directed RNA polymerase subunit omega